MIVIGDAVWLLHSVYTHAEHIRPERDCRRMHSKIRISPWIPWIRWSTSAGAFKGIQNVRNRLRSAIKHGQIDGQWMRLFNFNCLQIIRPSFRRSRSGSARVSRLFQQSKLARLSSPRRSKASIAHYRSTCTIRWLMQSAKSVCVSYRLQTICFHRLFLKCILKSPTVEACKIPVLSFKFFSLKLAGVEGKKQSDETQ